MPVLQAVELGRFILHEEVGFNGETWFLARIFEMLEGRIAGVVSFSDPVPRTRIDGTIVMPGHKGTIYQAHNGVYLGRGRKDTLWLLPDGRALSRRTFQKIRAGERGWLAATDQLVRYGAEALTADADAWERSAWLDHWMRKLTRRFKHPGNHKYAWTIGRRNRHARPNATGAYPKEIDRAIAA
ncbi:MAG TPA: hypothetical protein VF183_07275 [Acidimicrobiales bacterium]